ncbi:MAG: protein kinase [Deltaproteobacteria bacterium]|nr:protein kinase [Deltaproteobacteria bacterium]
MSGSHLAPGSPLGPYQIVRPIGGGGMAQIYLAKTSGLAGFEKFLALKVINPEYANEDRFIQMLIDEAKITVGLSHVNIAQVFDLGQVDNTYYIAMEFVDGRDILEMVNGLHAMGDRLPISAVAFIGRQISSGLHYAHTYKDKSGKALEIVHRDISPQNVIVSRNGEVKVLDFGIAKAVGVSSKTQAGVIKGKVNYMAPEQAMGKRADRRCDIFATGIVMWEMLTSQMVYSSQNVGELVAQVRKAEIASPATVRTECPEELATIVMRALARDPEQRYQTAHALQVDLTRYLSRHAPGYGGTDLADIVERVVSSTSEPRADVVDQHASRAEVNNVAERHSLILDVGQHHGVLHVITADRDEKLDLDESLTIGRAGELAILDARISRQHARVFRRGNDYLVEDLGSSNGTFVNDRRIGAPERLKNQDEIRLGSARLIFSWVEPKRAMPEQLAVAPVAPEQTERRPPPVAPSTPVPKLQITRDGQTTEHEVSGVLPLHYRLELGGVTLRGAVGQLVCKGNEIWLEPQGGRLPIERKGQPLRESTRLEVGESFNVCGVSFRLTSGG